MNKVLELMGIIDARGYKLEIETTPVGVYGEITIGGETTEIALNNSYVITTPDETKWQGSKVDTYDNVRDFIKNLNGVNNILYFDETEWGFKVHNYLTYATKVCVEAESECKITVSFEERLEGAINYTLTVEGKNDTVTLDCYRVIEDFEDMAKLNVSLNGYTLLNRTDKVSKAFDEVSTMVTNLLKSIGVIIDKK